jgi:hypothetical protein
MASYMLLLLGKMKSYNALAKAYYALPVGAVRLLWTSLQERTVRRWTTATAWSSFCYSFIPRSLCPSA